MLFPEVPFNASSCSEVKSLYVKAAPSFPLRTVTDPISSFLLFLKVIIVPLPSEVGVVVAVVTLSPSVPGFPLGIVTLPITGFVVFVVLKLT